MTTCYLHPGQLHNWGNNDILGWGNQEGVSRQMLPGIQQTRICPGCLERDQSWKHLIYFTYKYYISKNHRWFRIIVMPSIIWIITTSFPGNWKNDNWEMKENNFWPVSFLLKRYLIHCSRRLHDVYILLISPPLTEHSTQSQRVRMTSNGWHRAMWILEALMWHSFLLSTTSLYPCYRRKNHALLRI